MTHSFATYAREDQISRVTNIFLNAVDAHTGQFFRSSTEYLRACMGTDLQGDWAEIRIYAENSYVLTDRVIRRGSHDLVTKLAASG